MDSLENYYSGDAAWTKFVEMFDDLKSDIRVIELAQSLNNEVDLAAVIYGKVGSGYQSWVKVKIPALDNISPMDCLADENLVRRLREMLMRMPC